MSIMSTSLFLGNKLISFRPRMVASSGGILFVNRAGGSRTHTLARAEDFKKAF
jgi:hypothetical protein